MLVEDAQVMPRRALGTGSQARIRWYRRHLHGGVGDVAARAAAVPGWTSQGEETAGGSLRVLADRRTRPCPWGRPERRVRAAPASARRDECSERRGEARRVGD